MRRTTLRCTTVRRTKLRRCLASWALVGLWVVALGVPAVQGQDPQLAKKRDQKLASPFLKKAAWFTDYDKAREAAQESGKIIFAYFTRSYAP